MGVCLGHDPRQGYACGHYKVGTLGEVGATCPHTFSPWSLAYDIKGVGQVKGNLGLKTPS